MLTPCVCMCLHCGFAALQASPARAASSAGRRRSRKRYLKYLPNMSVSHLLPVTAPCVGHGSTAGAAAAPSGSAGLMANSAVAPPAAAAGTAQGDAGTLQCHQDQQQLQEAQPAGCDPGCTPPQQHLLFGLPPSPGQPPDSRQPAARRAGAVLLPAEPHSAGPGLGDAQQLLQRHSQPPAVAMAQQQHTHSSFGSRLLQGLAVLRPAASDPLQQPRSSDVLRARPPEPQPARRSWVAADSNSHAPGLARHELCSDSVSSAARMDLRAASPGLSEGSGGSSHSHSGSTSSSHSTTPLPAEEEQLQQHPLTFVAQDDGRGCGQAGSSTGWRNAATTCRPSPFLHYNFAACLDP